MVIISYPGQSSPRVAWVTRCTCCQSSSVCAMVALRSPFDCLGFASFSCLQTFLVRTCQVMLVLGFLNVWPGHPNLLFRMSVAVSAVFVLSWMSFFLTIISGTGYQMSGSFSVWYCSIAMFLLCTATPSHTDDVLNRCLSSMTVF